MDINTLHMDEEDIALLAEILEKEKHGYEKRRMISFCVFAASLVSLIIMIVIGALYEFGGVSSYSNSSTFDGTEMIIVQGVGVLASGMVACFSMWWGAENCVNSIDRTLAAARAKRNKMFISFLSNIQCASKKKKQIWLDLVKSFVS